ncbi:MAG: C10 family peptidase [Culturomica sp.]|jgi:hypothetical protein|nr:C10 family peptidase [Culturomica sp.]
MRKFSFLLVFVALFLSCQEQERFFSEESGIESSLFDNELPEEEVLEMLRAFVAKADAGIQTRGTGLSVVSTSKRYYSTLSTRTGSSNANVPFYSFDLQLGDQNAFALVCADKRLPQVVAFSQKGNLEEIKTHNALAYRYIQNLPDDVAILLDNRIALPYWKEYSKNNKDYSHYNAGFPYEETGNVDWISEDEDERITYIRNYMNWSQEEPYNDRMDFVPGSNERYKVGCSNIATINIMGYYRYPERYDWDALLDFSSILDGYQPQSVVDAAAQLCRDVCNASLSRSSTNGETTTTTEGAIRGLNLMGFDHSGAMEYDLDTIKASLKAFRPVWMGGFSSNQSAVGHAFVVRGYWYLRYEFEGEDNSFPPCWMETESLGINWGAMGGFGDGFYLVRFKVPGEAAYELENKDVDLIPLMLDTAGIYWGPNYNQRLTIIPHIRPKENTSMRLAGAEINGIFTEYDHNGTTGYLLDPIAYFDIHDDSNRTVTIRVETDSREIENLHYVDIPDVLFLENCYISPGEYGTTLEWVFYIYLPEGDTYGEVDLTLRCFNAWKEEIFTIKMTPYLILQDPNEL